MTVLLVLFSPIIGLFVSIVGFFGYCYCLALIDYIKEFMSRPKVAKIIEKPIANIPSIEQMDQIHAKWIRKAQEDLEKNTVIGDFSQYELRYMPKN